MAETFRNEDIVAQIRRMQEQIRRLQTRLLEDTIPVEAWVSLAPYLLNGDNDDGMAADTGWYPGDATESSGLHPRAYRDRGRVYYAGVVHLQGMSGLGQILMTTLPDAYKSDRIYNVPVFADPDNSTGTGTLDQWWMLEVLNTGEATMDQNPNFMGSPNFGWPPIGTYLALDAVSYRHG